MTKNVWCTHNHVKITTVDNPRHKLIFYNSPADCCGNFCVMYNALAFYFMRLLTKKTVPLIFLYGPSHKNYPVVSMTLATKGMYCSTIKFQPSTGMYVSVLVLLPQVSNNGGDSKKKCASQWHNPVRGYRKILFLG